MTEENADQREVIPGVGQAGSSGNCANEGWAVFKWNGSQFVLEDGSHCASGYAPPPPPTPSSSERSQISTFNEFRAVVCCVSGGSSSS
jgi:hypothetical protein